eukprot:262632_1
MAMLGGLQLIFLSLLFNHAKGACGPVATAAASTYCNTLCKNVCTETDGCEWTGQDDYDDYQQMEAAAKIYAKAQMSQLQRLFAAQKALHDEIELSKRRQETGTKTVGRVKKTIQATLLNEPIHAILTARPSVMLYEKYKPLFTHAKGKARELGATNYDTIRQLTTDVLTCYGVDSPSKNFFANLEQTEIKNDRNFLRKMRDPALKVAQLTSSLANPQALLPHFVNEGIWLNAKKEAEEATAHREYSDVYDDNDRGYTNKIFHDESYNEADIGGESARTDSANAHHSVHYERDPHRYQVDDYLYPRVDEYRYDGGYANEYVILMSLLLVLCVGLACFVAFAICMAIYTFQRQKKDVPHVYRANDCNL